MNIGTQILKIRKEKGLTQEEFGKIFHVTRQTVSNWENEKSYPDLQILIDISNRFDISLDVLIKEDVKMVKTMDKERVLGSLKREKSVIDFFTGAGTGIVISCLFSADTMVRTVTIVLGVVMIGIGWYREAKYDKRLFSSYFQSIPIRSICRIRSSPRTIPLDPGCFRLERIFDIHLPSFTPFTEYDNGIFRFPCAS